MELKYLKQNKKALEQFAKTFPDVRSAFDGRPRDAINYLCSICKFVCAHCGKPRISAPILHYFNFSPDALCFDCQKLKTNRI